MILCKNSPDLVSFVGEAARKVRTASLLKIVISMSNVSLPLKIFYQIRLFGGTTQLCSIAFSRLCDTITTNKRKDKTMTSTTHKSVVAAVLCLATVTLQGTPVSVYVSPTGDDGAAGAETSPLKTIGAAVALCEADDDGGVVYVAAGDYVISSDIEVTRPIKVEGVTGRAEDVRIVPTSKVRPFKLNNPQALISSVSISGASLNGDYAHGGAVYIGTGGGVVSNCVLHSCAIAGWGASGAGAYLESDDALVTHCVVSNNSTSGQSGYGHGIRVVKGAVRNCLIVRNGSKEQSASGKYALYAEKGSVENCTIMRNVGYSAASVYAKSAKVVNCIIGRGSTQIVTDKICTDGTASCFESCLAPVEINNDKNCKVGEALVADEDGGNWLPGADAVNAGKSLEWMEDATDLVGKDRIAGGQPDIGCIEKPLTFVDVEPSVCAGVAPLVVTFALNACGEEAGGYTCEWNWDDGEDSETIIGTEASHGFDVGVYSVVVKVMNNSTGASYTTDPMVIRVGPKISYVRKESLTPTAPYSDWEHAARTLDDAVAAAVPGQEIIVSNGTHSLARCLTIDRPLTIRGVTGRPDDVILSAGKTHRHFIFEAANAKIESVTFVDGAVKDDYQIGGAIRIDAVGGQVMNCIFDGNYSQGWSSFGGAIGMLSGAGVVDRCVFRSNICKCNSSSGGGQAVYMVNGELRNCLILENGDTTNYGNPGGSVYATGGSVENCSFYGNLHYKLPGVYANGATVVNCILGKGTAQLLAKTSDAYYGGTASCFDTCACPVTIDGGVGCVVTDGLFRNAAKQDWYPGIDALDVGKELTWMAGAVDLAGKSRVIGSKPDLGCYEMPAAFVKVGISASAVLAPATVTFTVTCSDECPDGVTCWWDWDGDGEWDDVSTGTTNHTFGSGNHNVRVKVTNVASGDVYEPDFPFELKAISPIVYVAPMSADSREPYDSWAHAATNLADAVGYAIGGCEVVVSNGEYTLTQELKLDKAIVIRGVTGRPEDVQIGRKTGVNTRHFVLDNAQAAVESVTLENGKLDGDYQHGGSVRIDASGGVVSNCLIRGSEVYNWGSNGGAIYMDSDDALVTHCIISNNICFGRPGHGVVYVSKGKLRNCLVTRNGSFNAQYHNDTNGGPIYAAGGMVENCTVVDNIDYDEAGVYAESAEIVNCLICSNVCSTGQTAVCVFGGDANCFTHCMSDLVKINDNCYTCEATSVFSDYSAKVFTLPVKSPAVNAGLCLDWMEGATDLAGNRRRFSRKPDIGCYECQIARGLGLIVK